MNYFGAFRPYFCLKFEILFENKKLNIIIGHHFTKLKEESLKYYKSEGADS